MALALAGCGGGDGTSPLRTDIASVQVSPADASLGVGSTAALEVIVRSRAGDTVAATPVKWSSSDVTIARVSAVGIVTAVALGEARIAATVQGHSATADITVVPTGVAAVLLSPLQLRLTEGAMQAVSARVVDAQGTALTGRSIQWRSSDAGVATVSSAGVVTAVGAGSTSIIATSEGRSASIAVTVSAVSIAGIQVSPSTATVQVGANRQLTAELRDVAGNVVTGRTVIWSTNTPSIVSVSGTGLVVGVAPGTGTVTASSGGQSMSATITVEAAPSPAVVGRVTLSPTTATLKYTGPKDRTIQLMAQASVEENGEWTVVPDAMFTWSSSNPRVATVSPTGVVTAIDRGTTNVVVSSGGKSAAAEITVIKR